MVRPSADPEQPSAPELLVQLPALQVSPVAQALPHAPQLALLVLVSRHVPLHDVWPEGHAHLPPAHVWPPVHAVLQAPQSSLLVWVSTQAAPHVVWPVGQPHLPAVQC
jgi:hypothetical protein